uniref:Rhomboid domain-containing protein n=1 Tax=Steinernema glaseri TaxID=37863 RepID=A0A1I7XY47_9BILA
MFKYHFKDNIHFKKASTAASTLAISRKSLGRVYPVVTYVFDHDGYDHLFKNICVFFIILVLDFFQKAAFNAFGHGKIREIKLLASSDFDNQSEPTSAEHLFGLLENQVTTALGYLLSSNEYLSLMMCSTLLGGAAHLLLSEKPTAPAMGSSGLVTTYFAAVVVDTVCHCTDFLTDWQPATTVVLPPIFAALISIYVFCYIPRSKEDVSHELHIAGFAVGFFMRWFPIGELPIALGMLLLMAIAHIMPRQKKSHHDVLPVHR